MPASTERIISADRDSVNNCGDVRLNGYVVLFTLAVSLLSGALSALGPAWTFCYVNPQDALRERGESSRHSNPMHSSLVFIECALAFVPLGCDWTAAAQRDPSAKVSTWDFVPIM